MAGEAADTHAVEAATEHGVDVAHAAAAGAHGGGEHAAPSFPPFDTSLFASQLIWFAITFCALYFIVSRFIVPTVSGVLEKRALQLASDRNAAAQRTAEAEAAKSAMEKASAKARADARKLIDDMRADVAAKLAAEQAEASARLAKRAEESAARMAEARAKAMAEIPSIADALAREIADKLAPARA
jgi:F-type H+-transporting ATPase subunit b